MPLSASDLKNSIRDLKTPPSYAEAARLWAAAYASYAAQAISPLGGSPASLAPGQAVLQQLLTVVFATSIDPVTTATQMASGFSLFWLSPPVVFSGTPPGAVTAVLGTAALAVALPAVWLSNQLGRLTTEQAAQAIAAALDAFTRTVLVLHPTLPSPTIGPIG